VSESPVLELARFAAGLRFPDLPEIAVAVAKQCVLDTLGVTIAGAREPGPRALRSVLGSRPTGAPLIGAAGFATPIDAALINGTAGHALDFDDVLPMVTAHPSVPVLPAVLALASAHGKTGAEMLTAFVAGVEAESRVGLALGKDHYRKGFHATATIGTIGAAVASSNLLGLDVTGMATAISIAATQAAGLKSVFGTDCKPFHAGRAASAGVLAAQLSAEGFTSTPDALTSEQGFGVTHSGEFDPTLLTAGIGTRWHVSDCRFKFHAACYLTHATIENALRLRASLGRIDSEAVDRIEVAVPQGHLNVCNIQRPRTGLEGKFSLTFTAALGLVRGRADTEQFTRETVMDSALVQLARKIRVVPDNRIGEYAAGMTIEAGGQTLRTTTDTADRAWQSHPREQDDALTAKFMSLVRPVLGSAAAGRLLALLADVENVHDMAGMLAATQPTY
jgi:2-methylcitrate dehydratase PrpD